MSELDERPIMIFLDCGNPDCNRKWMAAGTYEGTEGAVPRTIDQGDRTCAGCGYPESILREWGPLRAELIGTVWVIPGQPWVLTSEGYKPTQ